MVTKASYKTYGRGQRQANVETDFTSGMMYSEGAIPEGYVKALVNFEFTSDGKKALKPRSALVTDEFILPDTATFDTLSTANKEAFLSDDMLLKYSKECSENGDDYIQFILGKPDLSGGVPINSGKLWVVTANKNTSLEYDDTTLTESVLYDTPASSAFYTTALTDVHNTPLVPDANTAFPVGAFLGNSFYFFSAFGSGTLQHTVFDDSTLPHKYKFVGVTSKTLSVSEAVNYGYNMLNTSKSAVYSFADLASGSTVMQMLGILPYKSKAADNPDLIMTPKAKTKIWFRCNYDIPDSETYKIVWSWKEVSADSWTVFHTIPNQEEPNYFTKTTPLSVMEAPLVVPDKAIMIRCEVYNSNDLTTVESAITVGFDFTQNSKTTTANLDPNYYDLSKASGMLGWKNRLVLWGVSDDPTILFISDFEDPSYFPYPNNISVFDEPIIAVTELMDNLIVFTKTKVHQVSLDTDGITWTSEVIQSNLYISPWDKHLIQPIRNMVYFKSGNYYYMIVPKAQSTTGELTLAPITTPITDFFNHFQVNVNNIIKNCYKDEDYVPDLSSLELITYYNFVDYESVHNYYVYRYNDRFVHFDIIYNVVDRYWCICIYEASHFLYPFRNDATQTGLLAQTSVMQVYDVDNDITSNYRFIQIMRFVNTSVEDLYLPSGSLLDMYSTLSGITYSSEELIVSPVISWWIDEVGYIDDYYVSFAELEIERLKLLQSESYLAGFNVVKFNEELHAAYDELRDSAVFPNRQMLDTGYRDAETFVNKRYRELQLQINNLDNVDMEFGMDFRISGEPRNTDFLYEVSQVIDEFRQDEGIVYIDATPYVPIPWKYEDDEGNSHRSGEIEKVNCWTLKHSLDSDISLWKVRAAVSGKGTAPRLRLFTKSGFNYQLLGINWVYREMNMR